MAPEFLRGKSDQEVYEIVRGQFPPDVRKKIDDGELGEEGVRNRAFDWLVTGFTYRVRGSRGLRMTVLEAIVQRTSRRVGDFPVLGFDPETQEGVINAA